jgi:biopolymer transport protein TolR
MTSGRKQAEINVTPLIDVLLVLLIIFMVTVPTHSVGLDTLVPQEPSPSAPVDPNPRTVVVRVAEDGSVSINSKPIGKSQLATELLRIYVSRAEKVLFITGDNGTEFQKIASVIDVARGAGINQVALLKPSTLIQ